MRKSIKSIKHTIQPYNQFSNEIVQLIILTVHLYTVQNSSLKYLSQYRLAMNINAECFERPHSTNNLDKSLKGNKEASYHVPSYRPSYRPSYLPSYRPSHIDHSI